MTGPSETLHFCVVCPSAEQVFLMGPFNNWSTTATPMQNTESHVWQLSMNFTGPGATPDRSGKPEEFAYFVVDRDYHTGRSAFGPTYLLPGSWATVVRTLQTADDRQPIAAEGRGSATAG